LGYIWLDRKARNLKDICQIIKTAIKDIQRHSSKEKMRENALISFNKSGEKNCALAGVI
jgi:hypothetical protein